LLTIIGNLPSVLALTRFFATTFFWVFATIFFWAFAGLAVAFGAGLFNEAFGVFFTAFLTLTFFATFLATFVVEILCCFDPEAVLEEASFFFNSFFFFETSFELALAAATLFFTLPFWRLESVSLITISFYMKRIDVVGAPPTCR
jgi:hypothetical protein